MLYVTTLPVEGNVDFCVFRFERFWFGLLAAAVAVAAAAATSSSSTSGLGKRIKRINVITTKYSRHSVAGRVL